VREYNTALNAFKLEFDGMPGDFKEAESYELHTDQNGNINTCNTNTGTGRSGDGDGLLESAHDTVFRFYGEVANFFFHIQNAGLLNQSLTTSYCSITGLREAGKQYPKASIGKSLLAFTDVRNSKLYYFLGGFGETKDGAGVNGSEDHPNDESAVGNNLTSKEASDIDKKIDDGKPSTGISRVVTQYPRDSNTQGFILYDTDDNSSNCIYNSAYNVGYDEEACTLAIEANRF
jgi:hypothetical protein